MLACCLHWGDDDPAMFCKFLAEISINSRVSLWSLRNTSQFPTSQFLQRKRGGSGKCEVSQDFHMDVSSPWVSRWWRDPISLCLGDGIVLQDVKDLKNYHQEKETQSKCFTLVVWNFFKGKKKLELFESCMCVCVCACVLVENRSSSWRNLWKMLLIGCKKAVATQSPTLTYVSFYLKLYSWLLFCHIVFATTTRSLSYRNFLFSNAFASYCLYCLLCC
jgi:hypothetical protein